jgi:hypothetical protein
MMFIKGFTVSFLIAHASVSAKGLMTVEGGRDLTKVRLFFL